MVDERWAMRTLDPSNTSSAADTSQASDVSRVSDVEIKRNILQVCRMLHEKNFLAAADGNVTVKVSDEKIWCTPSGRPKAFIDESEIACIDMKGNILSGHPSAERAMHIEIYRRCPKAKAVVHAHTPTAVAWTVARPDLKELPAAALPEVILAAGHIPIVPYTIPTTEDMAASLRPYLPQSRMLILSRHGAVSWGESLEEAYMGIERLEHAAETLRRAATLGDITEVSAQDLTTLRQMREKIGDRTL